MANKFIWVRNPSGTTTYVDHRGDDANGDGTAQNPYQTILKATTVASANTNIVIGDGVWTGSTYGNKGFKYYGNAKTRLVDFTSRSNSDIFTNIRINIIINTNTGGTVTCVNSYIDNISLTGSYRPTIKLTNSILINSSISTNAHYINHCVIINLNLISTSGSVPTIRNSIIFSTNTNFANTQYCNVTSKNIPNSTCINNSITGQTATDYFNHYSLNYLLSDFTAKAGSANIGAGENNTNIGLNEGYPARATNDSSDIFSEANGATVRNIVWNATLNGYSLAHKDKVCTGSTANTITLASDAEATDDYYNDLFIGITAGNGYGEIHRITDYDGTTKVATIDTAWTTQPDNQSIYSISGTIDSKVKDFGKVIKVKRNFAFLANMHAWSDANDASYGMWKEFITTPLQNNGVWELRPCNNFRYEYSLNGTDWNSNTELIAGTDTDNKTYNAAYGNASESYVAANAKITVLRYVRYHIEIGFNIGEDAQ